MIRPTRQQLAPLTPFERLAVRVADLCSRAPIKWLSRIYCYTVMQAVVWLCACRRWRRFGLEHIQRMTNQDRILLVANHRSFFDYFVVSATWFGRSQMGTRAFYPVRSTFFYERPLGIFVNTLFSGMAMFPPVMRDRSKAGFNAWGLKRMIAELSVPGTVLGMHPEGTRNKSDDPYNFLPARAGAGRIALGVPEATVLPIYVRGMGSNLIDEIRKNWLCPQDHPIHLWFGEPVDFSDLRAEPDTPELGQRAAERCMEAITALADRDRQESGRTIEEDRSQATA